MNLGQLDGPVLVFGGPYSNLAATEAVKAEAERLGIPAERVICSGDLVAYCAQPEETVALIRDWNIHVVMGNCEESLAQGSLDCGCGFEADSACSLLSVEWYNYSNQRVSSVDKAWMSELPRNLSFSINQKRFMVVHGSFLQINEFVFPSSSAALKTQQLSDADVDVMIGGHCGLPFSTRLDQGAWLNSGVIGMPANDGTSEGWYMLITPVGERIDISWHRLAYDVQRTVNHMQREYVSAPYAQCLQNGLWPSLDILPEEERSQTGIPIELPSFAI